jgi:hypothetical protein
MQYNQGQSLQQTKRWAEAAAVALGRRELWRENASRLYGVAGELAEIAQQAGAADPAEPGRLSRDSLDREVLTTLRQVLAAGWPPGIDLASDARFDYLNENRDFAKLLAEVKDAMATN